MNGLPKSGPQYRNNGLSTEIYNNELYITRSMILFFLINPQLSAKLIFSENYEEHWTRSRNRLLINVQIWHGKLGYFHISLLIAYNQCPTTGKVQNSYRNHLIIFSENTVQKNSLFTYYCVSMQNFVGHLVDEENQKNSAV